MVGWFLSAEVYKERSGDLLPRITRLLNCITVAALALTAGYLVLLTSGFFSDGARLLLVTSAAGCGVGFCVITAIPNRAERSDEHAWDDKYIA